MFFGLPWFAVVAIVAIVGGLYIKYREQELEMDSQAKAGMKHLADLSKTVQHLKERVENLEAIVAEESPAVGMDLDEDPADKEGGEHRPDNRSKSH